MEYNNAINANTNLYEIKIIYDLAHLEVCQIEPRIIERIESLIFSAGHFVIIFIQNLCGGYNREYRSKFFNPEFDTEEYLKDNKNIYQENANFDNSVYGNFVRISKKSSTKKLDLNVGKGKKFERQKSKLKEEEKLNPLDKKNTIETIISNQPENIIELDELFQNLIKFKNLDNLSE